MPTLLHNRPAFDHCSTDTPLPLLAARSILVFAHFRPASAPLRSTLSDTKGHSDQGLCPSSHIDAVPVPSVANCQHNDITHTWNRCSQYLRRSATQPPFSPLRPYLDPLSVHFGPYIRSTYVATTTRTPPSDVTSIL